MRGPLFVIGGLCSIILVLSIVQVMMVNDISTSGVQLSHMQGQIKEYKLQNEVLKEQYLELSSFTTIEEKAKKIGFVEAKTQVNLTSPMPLALR